MADNRRVVLCSHRLGGTDGVSIEATKWQGALVALGYDVVTVAGSGTADIVIPALQAEHMISPDERGVVTEQLQTAFTDAVFVVVENICSLKLNEAACELVADVLRGRKALFHHHDLAIERTDRSHLGPPPNDPHWRHVCISHRAHDDLLAAGVSSDVLYNHFDTEPPPGDRQGTRKLLGMGDDEFLVLQPTRAIARKNIAVAATLAEKLGATFWLLGNAEDGYDDEIDRILSAMSTRVIRGTDDFTISIDDAYAASDLVTLTSSWEGFGNPTIESAIRERPLVIGDYPVAEELLSFGFRWFKADQLDKITTQLRDRDDELINHNAVIAKEHFDLGQLPRKLGEIVTKLS